MTFKFLAAGLLAVSFTSSALAQGASGSAASSASSAASTASSVIISISTDDTARIVKYYE